MGIVGSKDDRGKTVLATLPPGFLDDRGKELRDQLDACLERNMWFFTIGGLLITLPIAIRYKTERPFFVAAITCPVADMYYGTLRCDVENTAFREHYAQLHEQYMQPAWKRDKEQQQQQQRQQPGQQQQQPGQQHQRWRPPADAQADRMSQQQQQHRQDASGGAVWQADQQHHQPQQQQEQPQQRSRWWR